MKPTTTEDKLKDMVENLRLDIKKTLQAKSSTPAEVVERHPLAGDTTPVDKIGLIIDSELTIEDLTGAGRIFPPAGLKWAYCRSLGEFKEFLKKRGIPAFLSFPGFIDPEDARGDRKRGLDCVRLLIKACKAKKLPNLPEINLHTTSIYGKMDMNRAILDYKLGDSVG